MVPNPWCSCHHVTSSAIEHELDFWICFLNKLVITEQDVTFKITLFQRLGFVLGALSCTMARRACGDVYMREHSSSFFLNLN